MRWTALGVLVAALCAGGCGSEQGEVYITVETIGETLTTVKFLEPRANAGNEENVISESTGTVSAAGYTWSVFLVDDGDYDVYIEWTGTSDINGRAAILLDQGSSDNQWAAVYPDTGTNVWAEQGGGEFTPQLRYYP